MDTVSSANAATAHLLAVKALLDPSETKGKVNGQAFNITDGNPMPFWDLCRIVWGAAGDTADPRQVTVIPPWIAYILAILAGMFYNVITLGRKSPPLNRQVVRACVNDFTYNIEKARAVLGYNPVVRTEEVLQASVRWELQRRAGESGSEKST